ncbi:MAG: hypothetical protein DMF73_05070 [Acidobacteria bacterium]|nr:MAG: hypothetical protein DMF73_05070 [Acidobacteriota bacterium]
MIFKRLLLLFVFLLCFAIPVAAQEKYGTVYFYRGRDTFDWPQQMNVLNPDVDIHFDGHEFLKLSERSFIGFRIPAGAHTLWMTLKGKTTTQTLWVNAGRTYYVRISQEMYPLAYQMISQVNENIALESIRKYDALKLKNVKFNLFETIRENPYKKNKKSLQPSTP